MGLWGAISLYIALVSLIQIPLSRADCPITYAVSAGPGAILIKWEADADTTHYILDLRVTNNTNFAPVVALVPKTKTEKEVQGLRPGTNYTVTLKGLEFMFKRCHSKVSSCTVPDTAQITSGVALSSSSISLEWTEEPSAEHYYLVVISQSDGSRVNLTYSSASAVVRGLQDSTNYDFYIYTANHCGLGISSRVRTVTTLVRPPTGIIAVQTGRNEADVTWQPVEDVLMYRVSVREAEDNDTEPLVFNVTETMIHLTDIQPCSEYLISISSYNMFLVPSEPNVYSYTTNTLNPVSTVSVEYSCITGSVRVMWMPVLGADSYKATAVSESGGAPLVCTGSQTSCTISGVSCGTAYDVHVTPISENCENQVNSTSASFHTTPCPPQNLSLLRTCDSEVIVFSWDRTSNTKHYRAKSVDSKGVVMECLTEDNSCYFTHTECGRHYYFSVYSISDSCNSASSEIVDINTAPCIPQNVQISADCYTNALVSKWDLAEGALNYTVEAYGNVGNNSYYTCISQSNSCSIQGLHCGEALTVYITSHNEQCSSPRSLVPEAQTAPCVPQNVAASTDCAANAITVSWNLAGNAIFYMAMVEDSDGNVYHCNTLDLTCTIEGLKCSTNYTAYVISSNVLCNSSMSNVSTIETVACSPSNIVSTLNCTSNEALISWTAEPRIKSFTATAEDEDNGLLSCSSTTTSCVISGLKCDHRYTVTVGNHDDICPILYSDPIFMDSVHCGPDVTANISCNTRALTASWEAVSNAASYEILLSNATTETDFSITDTSFTSSDLECGTTYTLDVSSIVAGCISHPTRKTVTQVPCAPMIMMVQTACQQSNADVTWQESRGAESYEVTAVSSGAPQQQCNSTESVCTLEDLVCGQTYNITVAALNDQCYSQMSEVKQLMTEPCPPSGLAVTLDCAANSALLIWSSSPNAVSYSGRAVSTTTGHTVTCATEALGCQLEGLQCGQMYDFFVTASDDNCESADSDAVTYSTAPCPVTNVSNNVDCATDSLTTTWPAGDGSLNYTVRAEKTDGTVLLCQSDESSCVISNLPCGEQYSVTVSPVSSTCTGEASEPQLVNTVPCVPSDMRGELQCSDNTLHASWSLARGATSYTSTVTAGGVSTQCLSSDGYCSFIRLQCAQNYTLTVTGLNDRCNSSTSTSVQTAPCDPTDVSAVLDCPSGMATVNWTASAGAAHYTVLALGENNHQDKCGSVDSSCELQNLHCGLDYSLVVLAGDGICNSTVLSNVTITTAPCAPVMQDYTLDCGTNNAVVPWVKDEDALSVTVTAVSTQGDSVSCSSADNSSCVLSDLQCGSTYTVTAVAQGVQCVSEASAPFDIVTAPCTPGNVEFSNGCQNGISVLSWQEALGRRSFYVIATSESDSKSCSSEDTGCSLTSMLCGQMYNVSVFAIADHCNSSVPGVTQIQTAPCAPQDVVASLVCLNNTGSVSWTASPGAVSYTVKAFDPNGNVMQCTTSGTSCDIPNMQCGENYRIQVTPFSDGCQGYDSQEVNYRAGPCPPTEFTVVRECSGNQAVVTWAAVPNAEYYEATGYEASTDHAHNCSTGATSCNIDDLHCGETVSVTVLTKERGCWSQPSQPFVFEAVICPPTGLTGETTCSNNDITVSWDPSPKTGVTYFLDTVDFEGNTQQYSTESTSHLITGLQCGELLSLQVSAQYQECTSDRSEAVQTPTAPCPPTDLTATADCGTSSGTLTWTASPHATLYTVTFNGEHGHTATCTSNTTSCTAKLECGHQYTASIYGSTSTCDGGSAVSWVFNSAPCLPGNVAATPNCAANSFAVTWDGNAQDGPYTAHAIGSDGSRLTCEGPNSQCTIESLQCGLLYSIVVTTENLDCGEITESDYKVYSAPCKPTNVSIDLDCDISEAVVSWQGTGPNQEQEVTLQDARGNTVSCSSSSLQCTFSNLSCGLSYDVSVVSQSGSCNSEPSNGPTLHTGPCVATDVVPSYDCGSGITLVTWISAEGATSYTVKAKGSLGDNDTCTNSDSSCDFTLVCGQDYNITVQAENSACTSAPSETAFTTTGPCPHTNVATNLDCIANIAVVSWTPGRGIFYYNATATALNVNSTEKCSTSESSCNITTMRCGESYSIEVSGKGQTCSTPSQGFERINSAPCPPTLLSVDSSCDSDHIGVSWEASQGSVTYLAVAENEAGETWTCESAETRCDITDLPCGQLFNVYLSGRNGDCLGARSNMHVFESAPCVPQNPKTELDCPTGFLNVSWDIKNRLPASIEFYVYDAQGVQVKCVQLHCSPSDGHCGVSDLPCGMDYDVKLKAVGRTCNSSRTAPLPVKTAPCQLPSFSKSVHCSADLVNVTWSAGVAGVTYTVTAVGSQNGDTHSCSSSEGGCSLGDLDCGIDYSITITPSQDGCVGNSSASQILRTVPCKAQLNKVEIDCLTNSAWIMGTESRGAEDYVITAVDSAGVIRTFECNSTLEDMCFLPTLACSMNYSFTVQARDQQCSSNHSNVVMAETGPCSPEEIVSQADCENNIISIRWAAVPGAVSYTARLEDFEGNTTCCTSSDNNCQISDLPCGQMYILLVTAEGRTCNSAESREMARTAPCVPENLDYRLRCSNNLASMSWDHSQGGQLYQVTALSQDNFMDKCSGHENKCDLTNLQCGQTYTVTVTAEDMDCRSQPSESVSIKTAPCTPQDLSSDINCSSSSMLISWTNTDGADAYVASVEDSYGQMTSCQASTEAQCSVLGLGCGVTYHVSLVASDGTCDSPPTNVLDTPSVPCRPEHVKAELDCERSSAMVCWYPSDGAVRYIVTATSDAGAVSTCQTDDTTNCELEDLECGESYSVQVLAVGEKCNATSTMAEKLHTGPCISDSISIDYSMSIGQVMWVMSLGAERYAVEAVTDQGSSSQCETEDSYCALYDIACSQTYSVTVTAFNDACSNGLPSNQTQFKTEPCPPQNVEASVRAETDRATVNWEPSVFAVSYEATLSGRNGDTLQCDTEETYCEAEGLECGVIYHIHVIAIGETMNSTESQTILLEAGPCPVEDVIVDVDCYNNSAVLMWDPALGATSYKMIVTSTEGHRVSCATSGVGDTLCELEGLKCGQTYSISAKSINDQSYAVTDTGVTFSTRPCKPLNVGVHLQCGTATATLFWEDVEGVEMYNATAVSSSGVTTYCSTDSPPCLFSDLDCGETYEFYVEAVNDTCSSEVSDSESLQTEPCQPSGLEVQGSCSNSTVELSWLDAVGALKYTVDIHGDLGYATSLRTSDTSIETDLPCGQLYTFTVQAQDDRCSSVVSQSVQHQSGPCVPRCVESYTSCENNLGAVSWGQTDGADYYIAFAVAQDGSSTPCTTENTTCVWDDLLCGELYTVYVTAINDECESEESNSTTIRMASCIPQNLVSTFNCSLKVGHLSWDGVDTADSYIATAESNSGHKIQLSTNDTWAYISEFSCGEEYFLSVQSVDEHCTSVPSVTSKLQSEPCPPTDVSSFMNCVANIAVVSWNSSAGADYYTATVTSEEGTSQSCWSDNDQCGIPNLRCGQHYSVSVVASNEACNSEPSEESHLMSVPCIPTNVKVNMNCEDNEATVSWDASPGALRYAVSAQGSSSDVSCETDGLSCVLTGLTCGQAYSVQVVAKDDICSSLPSPATTFNSVPCVPETGSVVVYCSSNSGIVDWMFSEGASLYVATAESPDGDVSTCSSNNTHCELMDLQCGQIYTVSIQAANDQCRSSHSTTHQFESVPCPPQGLMSSLDCSSNSISVQWEHSTGADKYYVEALGIEEDVAFCTSENNTCVLEDLRCGFTYNISVSAQNEFCNISSSVIQQHSVPCIPQHLRTAFDCENKDVKVTWEQTRGAVNYSSVALGLGGFTATCNTSDTWCTFSNLACDMNYTFTVVASDGECSSHASDPEEIYTGPCEPQDVTTKMLCDNNTGVVSWEEGEGVTSYSVHGFGPDGHSVSCDTQETSCQLPSMHCGQMYNLTVTANDGRCDNSQTKAYLNSVPCSPTNVGASLRCVSDVVAVTWEPASGAKSYLARAVSADGTHSSECNNTETHCDLVDLQCGTEYTVTVFGRDDSCSSVASATATVRSAPCTPENVVVNEQCAEGSMTVSWSPNPDAQYFLMNALSSTGADLNCNTTETSCSFADLPCGQAYAVVVVAFHDNCPSAAAGPLMTSSAPCVPTNITGNLDCVTNSAWIIWIKADGASSYYVWAEAAGGTTHNSSCTSAESPCGVPDLKCGTLYNITVTAQNDHCNSTPATGYQLETAPCALTSISAATQCESSVITVQWEVSDNMPMYVATAEGHDMSQIICNSTSDSCQLTDATCGMKYTVIVSTSSDKCSSLRSPPRKISTAPCAPENVTAVQSCSHDGVTVSYALSAVASSYRVEATGADFSSTCESSGADCTIADLPCGQSFELTVYALAGNCTSPGTTISYSSGPCPPSGLSVQYDCEGLSADLSWDPSTGTDQYFASAQAPGFAPIYCSSAGLSCTVEGLSCGYNYSFTVEASNSVCNSSSGTVVEVGAVPCAPTEIRVRMQLMTDRYAGFWAMITWDRVSCPDVEYQVTIAGHINDDALTQMHITSYWLERNYYETPLPTSSTYKINVYARNQAGVSQASYTQTGVTVPSPPQNVVYNGGSEEVTWNASVLANLYTVYENALGTKIGLCETALLTCAVPGVDPANIEVTASNEAGTSLPSAPTVSGSRRRRDLGLGFLPISQNVDTPTGVSVSLSGSTLTVEWDEVTDAVEYRVDIENDSSSDLVRFATTTKISVTGLGLGSSSSCCARVAARTSTHQSPYSTYVCT